MHLTIRLKSLDPTMSDRMTWEELASICWRFGQLSIASMTSVDGVMTIVCEGDEQTCESWCFMVNWPHVNKQFDGRWEIIGADYSSVKCIIL